MIRKVCKRFSEKIRLNQKNRDSSSITLRRRRDDLDFPHEFRLRKALHDIKVEAADP